MGLFPRRGNIVDEVGSPQSDSIHPKGMKAGFQSRGHRTAAIASRREATRTRVVRRAGRSSEAAVGVGGSVSSVFWHRHSGCAPFDSESLHVMSSTTSSTETKSPKKPFSIATSLWDGVERKFGPRTLTTFGSRKEAHSAFLLASTTIQNGFKKLTVRSQSKAPDVSKPVEWALTRVEFLNRNGARIEAFHLTKSERGLVSRGGTPFQKKAAKAKASTEAPTEQTPSAEVEQSATVEQSPAPSTHTPALDLSALDPSTLAALKAVIDARLGL